LLVCGAIDIYIVDVSCVRDGRNYIYKIFAGCPSYKSLISEIKSTVFVHVHVFSTGYGPVLLIMLSIGLCRINKLNLGTLSILG